MWDTITLYFTFTFGFANTVSGLGSEGDNLARNILVRIRGRFPSDDT